MERNQAIAQLISYALEKRLIQPEDRMWTVNTLLEALALDGCALPEELPPAGELSAALEALLDDAVERGKVTTTSSRKPKPHTSRLSC